MTLKITAVRLLITNCYLIQDRGLILVDCGSQNQVKPFLNKLFQVGISPRDIQLIILTHGHFDHLGSAAEIRAVTGAPVALHAGDSGQAERGETIPVHGITRWGKIAAGIMSPVTGMIKINPMTIDVKLGDEDISLEPYGIPGRVMHTPGHTRGSVSVLLDDGQALVGDLAMNLAPLRFSPGLSVFGHDAGVVKASCVRLLELGAKMIYPSHGKPFDADVLRRAV